MEFKSLFFRKGIQIINYEPSAKGSFDDKEQEWFTHIIH